MNQLLQYAAATLSTTASGRVKASQGAASLHTKEASEPVTQAMIESGLQQLGLRRGDAVEVHSSLSHFGEVAGGASTVIAALINTVGEDGALVMSSLNCK
jgi:aminoglycoside N3'-acetyltransferase